MDDDFKEDDKTDLSASGIGLCVEYVRCNVVRPAIRGFLFGLGHYITYKLICGMLKKKLRLI